MKWADTIDIAIALEEKHPQEDPMSVRFTDLMRWSLELEEFDDEEAHCGERILEAIQLAWMDERD